MDCTWSEKEATFFPVFSKGWYPKQTTQIIHDYHLQKTEGQFENFSTYVESVFKTFSENQHVNNRRLWVRLSSSKRSDVAKLAKVLGCDDPPLIRAPYPFVLITTDGDNTPESSCEPQQFQFLLNFPCLSAWFSQNCSTTHVKLFPVPIGFDMHTSAIKRSHFGIFRTPFVRKSTHIFSLMRATRATTARHKKILYDMGSSSDPERRLVANLVQLSPHVKALHKRIPFCDLWKMHCSYEAGISVRGNGLDCHRTWEMLYFGMVPILRKQHNAFDNLFKGLPVVLVDHWQEILQKSIFSRISEARKLAPKKWSVENFWIQV